MNLQQFIEIVSPYSMTSVARISKLYESLNTIKSTNIEGDIAECGVWKGGNILGSMEYCHHYGMDKTIWAYDTFEGMTAPSQFDINLNDQSASTILNSVKCESSLEEFNKTINISKFDKTKLRIITGDINLTLNQINNVPEQISLLRLDTDWYESTLKELNILYPKITKGGICIIDDYGHWQGCRRAVHEYFNNDLPKYEYIDYTGIIIYV
jgi:hypothetical protein